MEKCVLEGSKPKFPPPNNRNLGWPLGQNGGEARAGWVSGDMCEPLCACATRTACVTYSACITPPFFQYFCSRHMPLTFLELSEQRGHFMPFLGPKTALILKDVQKKNWFRAKKQHSWAQKGPLWAIEAMKRPAEWPNGHLPENRSYPELPQDIGKLWSHWVGSVWPQKRGVIWV